MPPPSATDSVQGFESWERDPVFGACNFGQTMDQGFQDDLGGGGQWVMDQNFSQYQVQRRLLNPALPSDPVFSADNIESNASAQFMPEMGNDENPQMQGMYINQNNNQYQQQQQVRSVSSRLCQ